MAPKSRSLRRAGPRKDPGPPKGSSVACDGHAAHSGLLAVCEPNSRPALLFPAAPAHSPLAPSSAPDGDVARSLLASAHPSPAPACQRASPPALTATGTADAATAASPAPTGRPFHVRGSLLTGARKAYPAPVTLSRVTSGSLGFVPASLDRLAPEFTGRFSACQTVSQGTR